MTAAEPVATTTATAPGRSAATVVTILACLALIALAVGHLMFVIPAFASILAGAGRPFSTPTRLAIDLARFGVVPLLAWVAVLGWLYSRGRRSAGEMHRFDLALSLSTLVLVLYVALVSYAYVDVAVALPR